MIIMGLRLCNTGWRGRRLDGVAGFIRSLHQIGRLRRLCDTRNHQTQQKVFEKQLYTSNKRNGPNLPPPQLIPKSFYSLSIYRRISHIHPKAFFPTLQEIPENIFKGLGIAKTTHLMIYHHVSPRIIYFVRSFFSCWIFA